MALEFSDRHIRVPLLLNLLPCILFKVPKPEWFEFSFNHSGFILTLFYLNISFILLIFSIAAMYKTDERCEVVDMSKSYCDSGMILAVKEDSEYADTVKSLADCDGLKVAVKEGATSYNVAQSFLDENPDVSYEIVQYKDTVGCVSDLLAGRVDVVVNDLLNQKILSQEYEGAKIVCDPFTHAENAIAVQKGKDDLLAFINECIDEYYADGTYDTLWTKWIDASGEGEEADAAEDAETAE